MCGAGVAPACNPGGTQFGVILAAPQTSDLTLGLGYCSEKDKCCDVGCQD